MSNFRPVNTSLAQESQARSGEETNPTTPRPNTAPNIQPQTMSRDDATTPTRATFGALAAQRPLPATSFPSDIVVPANNPSPKQPLNRGDSQYSSKSRDSEDVDMDDSEDGGSGSDEESVNADGTRTKKKKSQRFFCTEYPPCALSFTRSEHLARHIRKHTGERPFQCHCGRRFSRLDNLRQHAQTVHQNEEIPQDSLAATGTRFQRQVRTDRVRPPGQNRSRANTAGSQTGPVRGHTRNSLSTSSIGSISSAYSQNADARRRPTPLVMAGEPRARFSQEIYRPESPSNQYGYRPHSPGGFSTPTSATFSTNGQNSPRWGSGMQSPIISHSRTASLYGSRTPGRRLSVPSAGNPFQSPHGNSYGPPVLGQLTQSNMASFSPASSIAASPTSSTWSRRESVSSTNDEAWRRRTWHPDSYSNISSRLQNVTTNHYSSGPPPRPASILPSNAPPLQQQTMRLPGIESFDPLPRPATPVRRQPSPMMIDTPSRVHVHQEPYQNERPNSQHWDMGINRNLNRLDLAQGPPDTASSWASEVNHAVQAQAEHVRSQPAVRFEESPYSARTHANTSFNQHASAPPSTPKSAKRQGWYSGPLPTAAQHPQRSQIAAPIQRTSPADSTASSEGGVPSTPRSNVAEVNPGIVHSNGWVDHRIGQSHQQPPSGYASYPQQGGEAAYPYGAGAQHGQQPEGSNMLRLEALVAVATAENKDNVAIHA